MPCKKMSLLNIPEGPITSKDNKDPLQETQAKKRKIIEEPIKCGPGPLTPREDISGIITAKPVQNPNFSTPNIHDESEEEESEEGSHLCQGESLTMTRSSSPHDESYSSHTEDNTPLTLEERVQPCIKEEPSFNPERPLQAPDISTPKPPNSPVRESRITNEKSISKVHGQGDGPIGGKDGILQHTSTSADNSHCPSAQIKEEPSSPEDHPLKDPTFSSPVSIKEEPPSSEEDNNPGLSGASKGSEIQSFTITGDNIEGEGLKRKIKPMRCEFECTSSKSSYECPVCKRIFSNHGNLMRHRETSKGVKMSCLECGADFCNKMDLTAHSRIHKVSRVIYCSECNKTFPSLSHLIIHERVHTREKPFSCVHCGKRFSSKDNLAEHMKVHTGPKQFRCTTCGKTYTREESLLSHQRVHEETTFICCHCGRTFVDTLTLAKHLRYHELLRPHSCTHCGKLFAHKMRLIKHERTHINGSVDPPQHEAAESSMADQPFQCLQCGKRFTRESFLLNHQQVHSGEKTFECSDCGSCFKQKNILQRHQKIHYVEKPFWCHECEKGFTTRSNLKVHRRVHILRRQHPCPHCGKEFPFKSKLNEHLKSHEESPATAEEVQT